MLSSKLDKFIQCIYNDSVIKIFDLETELISNARHHSVFNNPPRLVLVGIEYMGNCEYYSPKEYFNYSAFQSELVQDFLDDPCDTIKVGHGIDFDFSVLSKAVGPSYKLPRSCFVWDTLFADYLLSGQKQRDRSLEDLVIAYDLDCGVKETSVKEAMKNGVCPSLMDPKELQDYLEQDLIMTRAVFNHQRRHLSGLSISRQSWFCSHMLWRWKTILMSVNGINTALDRVYDTIQKATVRKDILTDELIQSMFDTLDTSCFDSETKDLILKELNPSSPKMWLDILNRTPFDVTLRKPNGVYKTGAKAGQTKYKRETVRLEPGLWLGRGFGDVSESTLAELEGYLRSLKHEFSEVVQNLLEYRKICKYLDTYLVGYFSFAEKDNRIHSKYNHTTTPTGRLTSSRPNLQNITS